MKKQKILSIKKLGPETEEVVDLSIKHNHNFYVSEDGDSFVLTHNSDMPDIDMDFDGERRDEIFDYLKGKYKNIASIGTTQNFGVKSIMKDVARVEEWPKEELDQINKISEEIKGKEKPASPEPKDLEEYLKANPDVANALPKIKELVRIVKKLYGSIRSIGQHASGICILDKSLSEVIPIMKSTNGIVTAYQEGEDRELSDLGITKMDILGLKNVTIIEKTIEMIGKTRGEDVVKKVERDMVMLNWIEDKDLLRDFKKDNTGVFQFDSDKNYKFATQLDPLYFRHLVDATALFRPDVLTSGQAYAYIHRKNGKEIPPEHLRKNPIIKEIAGETYYTFVYQEQIMFMLNKLFGFTMAEANTARKYISKKKRDELQAMLNQKLLEKQQKEGVGHTEEFKELIEMMFNYGGYSFNFAHAVAYTLISMQCVYLKHHYPIEFFMVLLNNSINDEEKLLKVMNSAEKYGLEILPPCVNNSTLEFSIEAPKTIRAGLNIVGGVSTRAYKEIERERKKKGGKFGSITDFLYSKIDWGYLNKGIMESLIKVGAFDCIETNRKKVLEIDRAFLAKNKKMAKKAKPSGQDELFSQEEYEKKMNDIISMNDIKVDDFNQEEKTQFEVKHFGFVYWTDIFGSHREYIDALKRKNLLGEGTSPSKSKYVVAYVNKIKKITSKAGKSFIIVDFLDSYGGKSEMIFSNQKNFAAAGVCEESCFVFEMTSYTDRRNNEEKFMIRKARKLVGGVPVELESGEEEVDD